MRFAATSLLALVALTVGCGPSQDLPVEPVSGFDLQRYLGTWYEIARMPVRFEEGLVNITATYRLRDDGKVAVINQGFEDSAEGKLSVARGKAKFAGDQTVGHLLVSFFGPFYADYVIFELDSAYSYAMVSGSSRKYLWILAREPSMPDSLYNRLVSQAREKGFDTERLIKTPQSW
ncbi:MAG: lipocalin [Chitinivibrionales bacterium]|nr:lipocalin [Chitinivibrionales bacterium]